MGEISKWLRFKTAAEDEFYVKLTDLAIGSLEVKGSFSKEAIIASAGLGVFQDAIRWDYVVRMIEEKTGTQLIPVAQKFFDTPKDPTERQMRPADERRYPGKYMATGHGKTTKGWVNGTIDNAHFFVKSLSLKRKRTAGSAIATNRLLEKGRKVGVAMPGKEYTKEVTGSGDPGVDDLIELVDASDLPGA